MYCLGVRGNKTYPHLIKYLLMWYCSQWIAWYNRRMGRSWSLGWWVLAICGILGIVVLFLFMREVAGAWLYSTAVAYEVIADGPVSPLREAKNFIIVSTEEWRDMWLYVHGSQVAPLPAVDFSRYVVLALFLGEKSSGGHSLDIVGMRSVGDSLIVSVDELSPGEGCSVFAGVTTPFTFVAVKKFTGSFATEVAQRVVQCTR